MLDWYISDWLKSLQVTQADLVRLTDYPKAKVADLVTGKQRYNRDILNDIANALNIKPFELLMHPSDAMGQRRMRQIVEEWVQVPHMGSTTDIEEKGDQTRKAG